MGVDVVKLGTSIGIGVADEVAVWWDEEEGRTEPFRTASDLVRLGGMIAGLGLQTLTRDFEDIGEAMSLASMPLVVKSVRSAVLSRGEIASKRTYVPQRRATPSPIASEAPRGGYRWKPQTIETG